MAFKISQEMLKIHVILDMIDVCLPLLVWLVLNSVISLIKVKLFSKNTTNNIVQNITKVVLR